MAFTLFRADAIYSASFTPPALTVIGGVPELLKAAYQVLAERYPGVPTSAFKVQNSDTLSEVGLMVSLLDARLEMTLRVDRFYVQATSHFQPCIQEAYHQPDL